MSAEPNSQPTRMDHRNLNFWLSACISDGEEFLKASRELSSIPPALARLPHEERMAIIERRKLAQERLGLTKYHFVSTIGSGRRNGSWPSCPKDGLDSDASDAHLRGMSRVRSRPKPDRRRALELLAASRDGCTEAILLAHGFTIKQIVELVRAGLAAAHSQRVVIGRRTVEIARVKITEAGRQALTDTKR